MIQVKRFFDSRCLACGLRYQPVDWLPWRVRGYCCEACDPESAPEPENDPQFTLFEEAEIAE